MVEIDLFEKRVTVESPAGIYKSGELIQAINSAEDSQGPMKAALKKNPPKKDTAKREKYLAYEKAARHQGSDGPKR